MRILKTSITTTLIFISITTYAQNPPTATTVVKTTEDEIATAVKTVETASATENAVTTPTLYSPLDIQVNTQFSGKDHTTLRKVSQGRTAGLVAAKVGLFALSIVGGLNGIPIPINSSDGFNKEQLIGGVIDDAQNIERLKNPAEAVRDQLKADFKQVAALNPTLNDKTRQYPVSVAVTAPGWKLVYDKLAGDAEQTNQYHLLLGLNLDGTVSGGCTYKSESKALDDWKANDYQAVVDEQPKIIKACVTQMQSAYARLLGIDKKATPTTAAVTATATSAIMNTEKALPSIPAKP